MKKILVLCIGLTVLFVLSACGAQYQALENSNKKIDKNEEVMIVYSAAAFEHMTSDEVIASFKDLRIDDVTENDDGSYTVTMPEVFHDRILQSIRDEVESELDGILKDDDLQAVKELKMNETMTELIVVIDQSVPEEKIENNVLDEFAENAFNYQMHNGVMLEDFTYEIVSIDDQTGEEIDRRSGLDNWER